MTTLFNEIFNLRITGYWPLLIWWFVAGLLFNMMPKQTVRVDGRYRQRWHWFSILIVILPYTLWAGYRGYTGDTAVYAKSFLSSGGTLSEIPRIITTSEDWGFYITMVLAKLVGIESSQVYFTCMAAFQLLCIAYIFRKYSSDFWISFFMFVASTDYLSWVHNGMRQFTAVCITFMAFELLVRKRYGWYAFTILIASTFHASALLMLPIAFVMVGPPLNRRTFLMIGAVALCIPMIDSLLPILSDLLADTQYNDILSGEIWENDDGTNIYRVLVYSVPAMIALFGFRHLRGSSDRAANMGINATLITMAVYLVSSVTSGIYIGRIPIYTTLQGYAVLPWMIDRIFEKSTAKLIKLLLVVCYLAFYAYQISIWDVVIK